MTITLTDFSFTATRSERGKFNLIMNTLQETFLDTSFKREENLRLSRFNTLRKMKLKKRCKGFLRTDK